MQVNVIERYGISNTEIGEDLDFLEDFIEKSELPWRKQTEKLENSYRTAQIALDHFNVLEAINQNQIFSITKQLTYHSPELCHDEITRDHLNSIIKLWIEKFEYLSLAIEETSIFLTPAFKPEKYLQQQLENAQCVMAFTCFYFKWLNNSMKNGIEQINYLMNNPLLSKSENLKDWQSHLEIFRQIFKKFPALPPLPNSSFFIQPKKINLLSWQEPVTPLKKPEKKEKDIFDTLKQSFQKKSLSLSIEDFECDCVEVPSNFSEKEISDINKKIEQDLEKKESVKNKQIKKIYGIIHAIYHSYLSSDWLNYSFCPKQSMTSLEEHLPLLIEEFFFHPPSHVNDFEFQLLINSLNQLIKFLTDNQNNPYLIETLKKVNDENLKVILEQFFKLWQPKLSNINSFFSFLSVNFTVHFIHQVLNPNTFYFIINRIMETDKWDLEDHSENILPLDLYSTDDKVTKQLAVIIESLGKLLINLGEPKGNANIASDILLQILSFKKNEIAKKLQQVLHKIKNSDCTMTPLLILYHLLFKKIDNTLIPIWTEWQKLEPENKIQQQTEIEKKLNDYLYQSMVKEIKNNSKFASWLVNQSSSIKLFCQTLTSKLWILIKEEDSRKGLICYLLNGVYNNFANHH